MLLHVDRLQKAYGDRVLFEDLGFHLAPGQKVALIARNGSGKTSLLRILAGQEEADGGSVDWHPDVRVGYLPQEPDLGKGLSVLEAILVADYPPLQAVRQYERVLALGEQGEALEAALAEMERHQAWDLEAKVKEVLFRLDLQRLDQSVDRMSGGERKRVALARVLIEEPELLILDEPTNHLDLAMVEWLEEWLAGSPHALLLVTHDRYFLDRICSDILEMDGGNIHRYRGNYADFLEKKEARMAAEASHLQKAKKRFKTELEWARRMPKARGTKSKYRMEAVQELRKEASKRLEEDELQIPLQMERLGSKVLELHRVRKGFGERVLIDGLDYKFKRPDRLGILGANGSGKSTLLDLLTGEQEPDGGKVVRGETLNIGHYRQDGAGFPNEMRVIEAVREVAEFLPLAGGRKLTAGQLCERFLFDRDQQYQRIGTLSGGEKRRLYLLTILMRNPNFLILDEPTNDLDLVTLSVLESYLLEYPGCLVVVSHDRFFLDKLVDHCWAFEGQGAIRDYPGNYSAYRAATELASVEAKRKKEEQKEADKKAASKARQAGAVDPAVVPKGDYSKRLSYKERREYERLEAEIEAMEAEKAVLETRLGKTDLDHEALRACSAELGAVMESIEAKTNRWLELAERA